MIPFVAARLNALHQAVYLAQLGVESGCLHASTRLTSSSHRSSAPAACEQQQQHGQRQYSCTPTHEQQQQQQQQHADADPFGAPPQLPQRRVVVTGLGMVSPLGVGVADSWSRLLAGHTGVRQLQPEDLPEVWWVEFKPL